MTLETQHRTKWPYFVAIITLILLFVLWVCFAAGRVLTGHAPWGPRVGGKLPNGTEVYFQARPAGFETDDRLTVIAPNMAPKHYWVDQVHGGFDHVVLKYNNTGNQIWVESDGKVGASIDLTIMISAPSPTRSTIGLHTGPEQHSTQGIQALSCHLSARGS